MSRRGELHPPRRDPAPRATRTTIAGLLAVSASILLAACAQSPARNRGSEPALVDQLSVSLAAKRLCSALWVSERDRNEALEASALTFLSPAARQAFDTRELRFEIDEEKRITAGRWGGAERRARFFGDQGCVILPEGSDEVFFEPVEVGSSLPPARELEWPMGYLSTAAGETIELDQNKVNQALEVAFSEPTDFTAAFLAVHQGQIIAERYGAGAKRETQLESWSMGKSVTATLIGLLIQQGHLELEQQAPVPQWHARPDDPRNPIRITDLLRMSSGLFFTHSSDDEERLALSFIPGQPDHSLGYVAPIDVFRFSESRLLEHPPNSVGRYRNCDPLVLGSIVKRTVEALGHDYLSWPQQALFDKIGTRRQVLETDAYGNFVLTGFDFGTGRGWARLGMLYLQDGVWQGERLLPEGFVEFVSSPAPAWENGEYGGLFWVGHEALPEGAYSMRGAGGQEVSIVPSHDLVLVRLGHTRGAAGDYQERRDQAYRLIVEAIDNVG